MRNHINLRIPIGKMLAAREISRVEVRGEVVARVRGPGCGSIGGYASEVQFIELGGLSPGWGEAALRLWVWLGNE